MSYDLVIERADGEVFDRAQVEEAVARWAHLRRYDAESYRSGGSELVLVAERPGQPVESLSLQIAYQGLPESFDSACDVALGLAERLGGRVVDAQLGQVITPGTRAASRAQAEKTAQWVQRLGTQFEAPPRAYVDLPAGTSRGAGGPSGSDESGRPWWRFWGRD